MKSLFRTLLLILLKLPCFNSDAQTIYSQWADASTHVSYTRTPTGALCTSLTCPIVTSVNNTTDNLLTNYAVVDFPVLSLLSSVTMTMDLGAQVTTGMRGGVYLQSVNSLLGLSVLPNIRVELLNNTTVVASETYASLLSLSLLSTTAASLCVQPSVSTYNKVRLTINVPIGVGVPMQFRVFYAFGNSSTQCSNGVLPVTLHNFTARAMGSCNVALDWTTIDEVNTKSFILQRKAQHENQWADFAEVRSSGDKNGKNKYHFTDATPSANKMEYRLTSLDHDGLIKVYETKAITLQCNTGKIHIYPTRVQGTLFISVPGAADTYSVQVHDLSGHSYRFKNNRSGSTITLDLSTLSAGIYVVSVFSSSEHLTSKVLVQ